MQDTPRYNAEQDAQQQCLHAIMRLMPKIKTLAILESALQSLVLAITKKAECAFLISIAILMNF